MPFRSGLPSAVRVIAVPDLVFAASAACKLETSVAPDKTTMSEIVIDIFMAAPKWIKAYPILRLSFRSSYLFQPKRQPKTLLLCKSHAMLRPHINQIDDTQKSTGLCI